VILKSHEKIELNPKTYNFSKCYFAKSDVF
jgi:hypothetical protein